MPGRPFDALRDYVRGEAARRCLAERRGLHLARYPQLAAPAFDHASIALAVDGRADAEALDWILLNLRPHMAGKTVIDVGANIGNHALAFSEAAGEVVALEPHPRIFRLLELNAELASNVVPLNIGASDREAAVTLATDPMRHGCTRITDAPAKGEQANRAKVVPLDRLELLDARSVGLIKIDVEGHEEAVLRGAEALLRRHRPVLIFEQHPAVIRGGSSPAAEFLRSLGYACFYSLEAHPRWRSSDRLPRFLRVPVRGLEALMLGPPRRVARLTPAERLEPRTYPMLIASHAPIGEGPGGDV